MRLAFLLSFLALFCQCVLSLPAGPGLLATPPAHTSGGGDTSSPTSTQVPNPAAAQTTISKEEYTTLKQQIQTTISSSATDSPSNAKPSNEGVQNIDSLELDANASAGGIQKFGAFNVSALDTDWFWGVHWGTVQRHKDEEPRSGIIVYDVAYVNGIEAIREPSAEGSGVFAFSPKKSGVYHVSFIGTKKPKTEGTKLWLYHQKKEGGLGIVTSYAVPDGDSSLSIDEMIYMKEGDIIGAILMEGEMFYGSLFQGILLTMKDDPKPLNENLVISSTAGGQGQGGPQSQP